MSQDENRPPPQSTETHAPVPGAAVGPEPGRGPWAQRFITLLEGFNGPRLARGLEYWRGGRVLDLSVRRGEVAASVQGSREKPYSVTLGITPYDTDQWGRVEQALAENTEAADQLLDGRLPDGIGAVFASCGLALLPTRREFTAECTCPDRAEPCKHTAAACYALAGRFDQDPFTLPAWRGRTRVELLRRIEALRDDALWHPQADPAQPPLAELLDRYWGCPGELPAPLPPGPEQPPGAALDRLGPVGEQLRGRDLAELLRPAYEAMSRN